MIERECEHGTARLQTLRSHLVCRAACDARAIRGELHLAALRTANAVQPERLLAITPGADG